MNGWVFIVLASIFQAGWLYNVKWLSQLSPTSLFKRRTAIKNKMRIMLSLFLYIVLGLSNIWMLTKSLYYFPPSYAYAIWTAITIMESVIIDRLAKKEILTTRRLISILCILSGIIILRLSGTGI